MSAAIMIDTNHNRQHSQRMNGMEYSMQTAQPISGNTTEPSGRTLRHWLRTVSLGLTLLLGLTGFSLPAWASVTVSMTSPAANTSVAAPGTFTLTATATSSNSTIKNVAFYNGTTLLATITTSPYTYTWSNVAAGTYSLTAKATDNLNATKTSTAVSVKSVTDTGPVVSLTSPAANTVVAAPASFTLTATATSSASTIASVAFYQGTTLLSTVTKSPYTYKWSGVAAGTYSITAIATDKLGKATTSTAVSVTSDAPPTVSLTSPAANASVAAPATFTLSASAASSTSTIKSVAFYNGTTLLSTVTTAPYTYTWSNIAAGTYSLTAKATDNANVATTSTAVSVKSVTDTAPTVSLTSPAANTVSTAPGSFTLTASATSSTSTIPSVAFYQGTTLLATVTSSPYTYNWTNVAAGNYSLTAVATDALGKATTSTAVAVVSDAAPTVSLTSPAPNTVATAPGSFTLTASAASTTSTIKNVAFYNGTTLLSTVTAAPYTYTWTGVAAGTYSLTAKATDNNNVTTTSSAVSVTSDALPTVSLTSPTPNTVSTATGSFTLTATAASSTSTIAKVDFYNGTILLGTATASPYTYTWSSVAAGTYSLTAKATDALGQVATSTAVSVVSDAAPTVNLTSPANNTVATAPGSFTLTANASSAGTITSVAFYNGTTLLGTVTAAPYTYAWTNVAAGTYSLTAKATDNNNVTTTSAPVSVISNIPPTVSLTSPAANAVSAAPGSFTLTASATSSTSTIAKVDFYASLAGTNTLIGTATTAPYTFSWSNVAAGSYSLTAVATDALGNTSTSAAVAVTITSKIPTTTVLTAPDSTLGISVTMTANVSTATYNAGISGTTVNFYDGATLLGSGILSFSSGSTWSATFTTTTLAQGTHSLTAVYVESAAFASSTSTAVTQTVGTKMASTTTLSSTPLNNLLPWDGGIVLQAQVYTATNVLVGSGTVNFWDGATLLGTSSISNQIASRPPFQIVAMLFPPRLTRGSHSFRAEFVGDSILASSTSLTQIVVFNGLPSTTVLSADSASTVAGTPVALTASVTGSTPIGAVTFSDTIEGNLGTANVIGGQAVLNYTFNTVGTHMLTASYGGDTLNIPSNSASPVTHTVSIATSTISVSAHLTVVGQTSTLIAIVTGDQPGGLVTFREGTNILGTATVTAGRATLSYVFSAAGVYNLSASYEGDASNTASSSVSVPVTINTTAILAYYIHTDQLDTPRQITDTNGNVVWQWDNSDPFGNNLPNENPSGQGTFKFNLRFTNHYSDVETNTNYNYFRDCYDPATGRYCQSDPIGLYGGSLSTYTYVNGNPLRWIDPYGLFVSGTYDAKSGTLSLTDTTTGASISGEFFSGGKPFGLPIPNGEYDVLEQAQKEGFFRLEPVDTPYGDDKQNATGRDLLRLHRLGPLGMSEGCITAKDNNTWKKINDFIGGTSPTDNVDVQSKSRNPFAPSTESLKRFGRITVINSPN